MNLKPSVQTPAETQRETGIKRNVLPFFSLTKTVKEVWHHWVQKPKTNRPAIPTVGCFYKKLSAPLRLAFTAVSRIIRLCNRNTASHPVFRFHTFWGKRPN